MKDETIARIRRFTEDRYWQQFHTPANLAKSISIEAGELLECFQWSETEYDLEHVKEELADVMVYCRNLLDELGLDEDEIINTKMDQNEAKYPVEKARGSAAKYDRLTPSEAKMTDDEFLQAVGMLDRYQLSIDEYNMALMLLFSFKSSPKLSADYMILGMTDLHCREKGGSLETWITYYKNVRRYFSSSLSAERRSVGSNDAAEVASYMGRTSAAAVLLRFRQDEEKTVEREILGGTPNLGDVRRVDFKKVAARPGEQFIRFWKDFINEES